MSYRSFHSYSDAVEFFNRVGGKTLQRDWATKLFVVGY